MSRITQDNPTEEEIIRNSKPNRLYWNEFEKGRFFQVVHEDEDGFEVKLAPRTMLKVVYLKDYDDIEGFEVIKVTNQSTQKVKLSKFNFAQLKAFLSFISTIDLKGITEKRLKILDDEELDDDTIKRVKTILSKEGGAEVIESLIDQGLITSKDIVNTSFRKRGLQIFERLLNEEDYWKTYAVENGQSANSEEKAWQYFLIKNEWIFGYGLDYRFQTILQREAHLSSATLSGSESVIGDYLLGDKRFTTFVELKKPSTPLFGLSKNRSGSWCLSKELNESVSQILEHKASGQVRLAQTQFSGGEPITQKAYDSKVILIIGKWSQLDGATTQESEIKKKTFELFRRDSRNIEFITFDELYERAKFIVEGNTENKIEEDQSDAHDESDWDDNLPF